MAESADWSEGLALARKFHPWGREPEGGGQAPAFRVARCRTSGWVLLRLVRARRGPVWLRILVEHRYGSIESPVKARRGPLGDIGQIGQSSVRSKNIKFGPKWVENRPFGPKQKPNEPNWLSGSIRTTHEAKNGQESDFLQETAPGGRPAAPLDPVS